MDFTNPLVYGVPCFLGLIALEFSYSKTHKRKDLYEKKDFEYMGKIIMNIWTRRTVQQIIPQISSTQKGGYKGTSTLSTIMKVYENKVRLTISNFFAQTLIIIDLQKSNHFFRQILTQLALT